MVAALERRDIDAFFLWEPWLDKAAQLVQGANVLARSGDDGVFTLVSYDYYSQGLIDDKPRALAATKALIEATDFCTSNPDEAAKARRQGFPHSGSGYEALYDPHEIPHGDAEGRRAGQFPGRGRVGAGENIIKKMPDWNDFIRPQFMKEVAPDRPGGRPSL